MRATVKPLEGGRYSIEIRGVLADGTAVRERYTHRESKAMAELFAKKRLELLYRGEVKPNSRGAPTLDDFFARWLVDHCAAMRHKSSGILSKQSIYRIHIAPVLGSRRIDEIDESAVAVLRGKVASGNVASKTVNNVLSVLGKVLKTAVEWRELDEAPRVKLVPSERRTMTFLSVETYDRLVSGARSVSARHLALVLLAGDAGLRASEILALEWQDVDLDRRVMAIRRAEVRGVLGSTKGRSERMVPMTALLHEALTSIRKRSGRVLGREPRMTGRALACMVERSERAAELPVTGRLHVLRHTYASHLVGAGASLYQLQAAMGHAEHGTTQGYAHVSADALQALARIADARRTGQDTATAKRLDK